MASKYVTTATIAEDLELRQKYVTDSIVKRPDFPEPAVNVSQKKRMWLRSDYESWKKKHARGTRRKSS